MAHVDSYTLDVVRKAVESDIEKNVLEKIRKDLLRAKFLGGGAAILIVIAAWFYKPIFEFVVARGGDGFHEAIKNAIKEQKEQGDKITQSFKSTGDDITRNFKTTGDFAKAESTELRRSLIDTRMLVEDEKAKLQAILKSLRDAQQAANEARGTYLQRLAAVQADADALRKALDETVVQINVLAENQKSIVAALSRKPDQIAAVQAPKATEKKPTVYFQFAGFDRGTATAISKSIQDKGWSISGEERTTAAVETNEIRFNPSDREIANKLKQDSDEVLRTYKIQLRLSPGQRINPGIPEVWIYQR